MDLPDLPLPAGIRSRFVEGVNGLTVHVLEAIDPASAILEFAAVNHVDHIIIGARQRSGVFARLGSVSSKIAFEAACTVTVVRAQRTTAPSAREDRDPPQLF